MLQVVKLDGKLEKRRIFLSGTFSFNLLLRLIFLSDRQFGSNVGCLFKTPEELFFEEEPVAFEWGALNPSTIIENAKGQKFDTSTLSSGSQEMIIMVGRPAAGKSTIVTRFLEPKGYVRVNMVCHFFEVHFLRFAFFLSSLFLF